MPIGLAIVGAAGIGGLSSIASGLIGSSASKSAASAQEQAADAAIIAQINEQNATIQREQPFVTAGTGAANALSNLTGTNAGGNPLTAPLTAPFASTPGGQQAALAATPGYQFTLGQGLLATQNSLAGSQPGGAALKSGINYAEGLASTTFQQQFQNYLTQNAQIAGILSGQASTGANAAAGLATVGTNTGNAISNLATGSGAASAAGTIGSANATTGAIGNSTNALTNAIGLSAIGNLFGSGSAYSGVTGGAGPLSVPTLPA
jgi:hypothetical protein